MVLAAPSGMQMREMYLPVTVSSSDMNPRVISSAHAELETASDSSSPVDGGSVLRMVVRTGRKGRNCLPDLTFSRASNNAFFRLLLSNLSTQEKTKSAAPSNTQQRRRRSGLIKTLKRLAANQIIFLLKRKKNQIIFNDNGNKRPERGRTRIPLERGSMGN